MKIMNCIVFPALFILSFGPTRTNQEDKNTKQDAVDQVSPEVERAIQKGLDWLSQYDSQKQSGFSHLPETVSFIMIAFMLNGHGPDDEKYGKKIRGWIDRVIAMTPKHTYPYGTKTFLHGIGTLAFVQAHKMTQDKELQSKIKKWVEEAVENLLTLQKKNDYGGWSYFPENRGRHSFVTCWAIQALWAAKFIGIEVPKESFAKASQCLLGMFWEHKDGRGNFHYSAMGKDKSKDPVEVKTKWAEKPDEHKGDLITCNTVGALGLAHCGLSESAQVDRTIRHILEHPNLKHYEFMVGSVNKCGHCTWDLGVFNGMQLVMIYKKYDWKVWRTEIEKTIVASQYEDGTINLEKESMKEMARLLNKPEPTEEEIRAKCKNGYPLSTALAVGALSIPKGKAVWIEGLVDKKK